MINRIYLNLAVLGAIVLVICHGAQLNSNETQAEIFLNKTSDELFNIYDKVKERKYEFNYLEDTALEESKSLRKIVKDSKKFDFENFKDVGLKYAFKKLFQVADLKITKQNQFLKLFYSLDELKDLLRHEHVPDIHNKWIGLPYIPHIKKIIRTSHKLKELRYYWIEWRKITEEWAKHNLVITLKALKSAAHFNKLSPLEFWLRGFNITDMENLMTEIQPLYKELHAFIRNLLRKKYGESIIGTDGLIPDHLFEQVLFQVGTNESIIEELFPYHSLPPVESVMMEKFQVQQLYEIAEGFYENLGFEKYPASIWGDRFKMKKSEFDDEEHDDDHENDKDEDEDEDEDQDGDEDDDSDSEEKLKEDDKKGVKDDVADKDEGKVHDDNDDDDDDDEDDEDDEDDKDDEDDDSDSFDKLKEEDEKATKHDGADKVEDDDYDDEIDPNEVIDYFIPYYNCNPIVSYSTPKIQLEFCYKLIFKDFLNAYAIMGYLHYAKEMEGLPAYFFKPPQGLEYAIGKATILSASSHHNLKAIGMIPDFKITPEVEMNRLFRMAITSLLNIPLDFVHIKVMADLVSGNMNKTELNNHYWNLMDKFVGVGKPKLKSSSNLYLPFSFYKRMTQNDMSRDFTTEILSYQLHKKLCEVSGKYPKEQLHLCDINGSKEAGNALKKMMQLGISKPFNEVLATMFPENPTVRAESLLEYYSPIKKLLMEKNREADVSPGWKKSKSDKS